MTQWPVDSAFEECEPATVAANLQPDVSATIQVPTQKGARFRLSIKREVLRENGLDAGDRFKVLITETAGAFYLRLVKDTVGRVQLSVPPLNAKAPAEAKRLLMAVSGVPDVGLPPRKAFEPVWRWVRKGDLDLRFEKPSEKPPATSELHDELAERLARKWAREGMEPQAIVKRLFEDQNKRVALGWVLNVLKGEV